MFKKLGKIICFIFIICLSLTAFFACSTNDWGPVGPDAGLSVSGAVTGENGGLAVQKGDYVYFVNGMADYTADNTFGEVVKGAICRRPVNDTNNDRAKIIVPKIFVGNYFEGGFYIFGDWIYYTTPNSERGSSGGIQHELVDFMMVKIDGTGTKRIAKLDPAKNGTDVPFKFFEAANGNVWLIYFMENALYKVNTTDSRFTAHLIEEEISGYAFGDSGVYYTKGIKKTNLAGEETEELEKHNAVYFAKPDADAADISAKLKESGSEIKYSYTILNFQKGILFYNRTSDLGGVDADKGIYGFNAATQQFKRFTQVAQTTFIAVGWDKGLIAYNSTAMIRYLADGTSFPMYQISGVTMYFTSADGGYLYYGINDSTGSASGAVIWRLVIPNAERDLILDGETQQITHNAVHNAWLKPKLIGNRIYFINLSNAMNEDDEYIDEYAEEGFSFYTFYVEADIAHGTEKEDIKEIWVGMHDESERIEED